MDRKLLIASVVLLASWVSSAYGRDLLVEVIGGKVRRMDTFTSDPYMSITICDEKKQTPVIKRTLHPVWNWKHQYKNVRENCRMKWHLYDEESFERDDTIGEWTTNVGDFLRERKEQSTISLGEKGDSNILVRVRYV